MIPIFFLMLSEKRLHYLVWFLADEGAPGKQTTELFIRLRRGQDQLSEIDFQCESRRTVSGRETARVFDGVMRFR